MATNDYEFQSQWQVGGTDREVYAILIEGTEYPRWWPQVYLQVKELAPGDLHGLGKAGELLTRGRLPYTLRWTMIVDRTDYPRGFELAASGDFVGRGRWQFIQRNTNVDIVFDWRIRAEKPLLRRLSWLAKPLFRANHAWAMAQGQIALRAEIARRRLLQPSFTPSP